MVIKGSLGTHEHILIYCIPHKLTHKPRQNNFLCNLNTFHNSDYFLFL